ncbi:unnamed protein product [Symbiodinium sp. CCMP2592]|nr:unnamed protein product [Symbiodinium sp. CCMP2592]CAE7770655.1 unnamed protein product [Symbiodinium sp. CCMP2592]CAE7770682.1 unnamed protein product [Symbiodinium sp. CCMP2592]
MVLARLQAKCAKQEPAAASTAEAADPKAVSKNKKPKKGVQKDIEEKMLPEKVLDSLRTLIPSEPAKPFLPSVQLLGCIFNSVVWAKDDEGGAANGPGDGDEEDPDGHKKAKASKKPKAKKAQDSKNCTASKVQAKKDPKKEKQDPSTDKKGEETEAMQRMKRTMTSDCAYVPGSYKEARLRFIARKRDRGFSWKEACQKWNQSSARASWLEGLSQNELKRRRFI